MSAAAAPRGAAPRRAAAGPLAQCAAVTRRFGQFTAVDRVDLQVEPGEIVGLLGANGAGKTTLIRLLLGLLPASEGEVALFGAAPSRETRRRIGYLPQGLGLYDDLTPAENLEFSAAVFGGGTGGGRGDGGRRDRGRTGGGRGDGGRGDRGRRDRGRGDRGRGDRGRRDRGRDEQPGLPAGLRAYRDTVVGSLPLGVQRRVAFAQVLSHRPDLLILDEPTSGVDPLGRARLWDTITDAAAAGAGVLVTTHHLDEADECGRLVIMAGGAVVAEGTAAEIVGAARVTVVTAVSWTEAFTALERSGLPVALAGRSLRVPGHEPEQVRRALGELEASVQDGPATLEERFFQLTLATAKDAAR